MNKKSRCAFTLAEVLITLGIIGVVAAITIPSLITYTQKKETVTKLQRAISVINQAAKLSFDDNGDPDDAFGMGSEEYFNVYWRPYIKVLQYCNTYQDCHYNSVVPFRTISGSTSGTISVVHPGTRVTFHTMDGFLYIIFTGTADGNGSYKASKLIFVDINGSKKPNVYGKDVFILDRLDDGKGVQPFCSGLSDSVINKSCSKISDGACCAEKIRRAGWKIDSTYPWK